jgi:hypothetical protein
MIAYAYGSYRPEVTVTSRATIRCRGPARGCKCSPLRRLAHAPLNPTPHMDGYDREKSGRAGKLAEEDDVRPVDGVPGDDGNAPGQGLHRQLKNRHIAMIRYAHPA